MSKEKLLKTLCNGLLYGMQLKLSNGIFMPNENEKPILKDADATLTFDLLADITSGKFDSIGRFIPMLRKLDLTKPLEDGSVPIVELFKIAFPLDNINASECEFLKLDEKDLMVKFNGHNFAYSVIYNSFVCFKGFQNKNVPNQKDLFEYLKSKHFNIEGLEDYIEINY